MARLVYSAIASLDGYVADVNGRWDWSIPDPEVHAAVNDLARAAGTHLYGRRMYDVLVAWETIEDDDPEIRDFAQLWRAADKVVYSRSLDEPRSARTRIEREFDPEAVRRMKAAAERDLTIGGPELAARAFADGLVDDCHLFLSPVLVGGGKRALPEGVRLSLELAGERRFGNGVVHLHHRASQEP